jgi:hypothetical protein
VPLKSAGESREEARRARTLAMGTTSQIVQTALLDIAARYDGLAHQAETLAALNSPEFDPCDNRARPAPSD